MAQFHVDFWGPKVELDHGETEDVLGAADAGSALGGMLAMAPPPADLVATAIGAYIGLEAALVRAVDQGNGVWLTVPWPAIWWGQFWLIVPTTR